MMIFAELVSPHSVSIAQFNLQEFVKASIMSFAESEKII